SFTGDAALVTDPANIGTSVAEETSTGLQFTHQLPGAGPIVISFAIDPAGFSRTTIESIATIGPIKEYFENWPVVGQQFFQLIAKISDVGRATVVTSISVPRRKIDAEVQSILSTSSAELLHQIALTVSPWAIFYGVFGVSRRPETKSIMMFGG